MNNSSQGTMNLSSESYNSMSASRLELILVIHTHRVMQFLPSLNPRSIFDQVHPYVLYLILPIGVIIVSVHKFISDEKRES